MKSALLYFQAKVLQYRCVRSCAKNTSSSSYNSTMSVKQRMNAEVFLYKVYKSITVRMKRALYSTSVVILGSCPSFINHSSVASYTAQLHGINCGSEK